MNQSIVNQQISFKTFRDDRSILNENLPANAHANHLLGGSIYIWKLISKFMKGLFCLLFETPPQQEVIEEARRKAMQYRGLF